MSVVPIIAVVDDDAAIREALDDLIRSLGYRTALFASAEDFLEAADRERIDCMIVDVMMPGLTGLELQNRLNAEATRPPTIFLTSLVDDVTRAKAMAGGAHCVLGKPVDDQTLLRWLRTALHQSA